MDFTKRGLLAVGASSLLLRRRNHRRRLWTGRRRRWRKWSAAPGDHKTFKSPSGCPMRWPFARRPLDRRAEAARRDGKTLRSDLCGGCPEYIWLMDRNGKVLKTIVTSGRNTSGLAIGNGFLWSCAPAIRPAGTPGTIVLLAARPCCFEKSVNAPGTAITVTPPARAIEHSPDRTDWLARCTERRTSRPCRRSRLGPSRPRT